MEMLKRKSYRNTIMAIKKFNRNYYNYDQLNNHLIAKKMYYNIYIEHILSNSFADPIIICRLKKHKLGSFDKFHSKCRAKTLAQKCQQMNILTSNSF